MEHFEKQVILACKGNFFLTYYGTFLEHVIIITSYITGYCNPNVLFWLNDIIRKYIDVRPDQIIESINKDMDNSMLYLNKSYNKEALIWSIMSIIANTPVNRIKGDLGEPDFEYFKKAEENYKKLYKKIKGV